MTPEILERAKRIVWTELPKYLTREFVIDDVEAEVLDGPFGEDYIHVNVILEDGHPELDGRRTGDFRYYTYAVFENADVIPPPTISFSDRSEFPERRKKSGATPGILQAQPASIGDSSENPMVVGLNRLPNYPPDSEWGIRLTAEVMKESKRIVWAELPKYLTREFVIDDIHAEILDGPFEDDYLHLRVIFEDGHPDLDIRKILKFKRELHPIFERIGMMRIPVISFSSRSEFPR